VTITNFPINEFLTHLQVTRNLRSVLFLPESQGMIKTFRKPNKLIKRFV